MNPLDILSELIENTVDRAEYEKLDDGSYSGRIAACPGVIAFATSLAVSVGQAEACPTET